MILKSFINAWASFNTFWVILRTAQNYVPTNPVNVHASDFNFLFLLAAPVNDNPCVFQGLNITIENMQEQYQTFARAIYCNKEPENIHLVPCHMTKRAYHANFTVFRKHRGSVEGMAKGCVPFNCTKWVTCILFRLFTFSLGVNWVIEDPELLEFLKSKLQQMFSMSSLMSHLQDKF